MRQVRNESAASKRCSCTHAPCARKADQCHARSVYPTSAQGRNVPTPSTPKCTMCEEKMLTVEPPLPNYNAALAAQKQAHWCTCTKRLIIQHPPTPLPPAASPSAPNPESHHSPLHQSLRHPLRPKMPSPTTRQQPLNHEVTIVPMEATVSTSVPPTGGTTNIECT